MATDKQKVKGKTNKKALKQQADNNMNKNPKQSEASAGQTPMASLDNFFDRNMNKIFIISILLTLFFGAFLFDVKVSTGGDDSNYIEMANDFIKGKAFPSWHGPLYSVFLSIPILLAGVNVIMLKIISFIFIVAHLVLFYYTFRNHISPTIFAMVMLIISVNSTILYFASQTYSEAMYMFLQSVVVFLFVKIYLLLKQDPDLSLRNRFLHWLALGFFIFLASLTRNIGIVGLLAIIFFLAIDKKFRDIIMLTISYLVFLLPYRLYKSIVWDTGYSSNSQLAEILYKNQYNKALGKEDFSGMVVRFFENAQSYLSKHFMIGIGLHDPSSTDKSWFVAILIMALFILSLYFAFRKSKIMFFIALYLGASVSATFIALQQSWDQMRMVIIYIPMLLLLLAWGIQQLGKLKGYGIFLFILPLLLLLILFKTFGQTVENMKVNKKVLARNIKGNMYYGFTPDWQNYLMMSEWVSKNIPESSVVASRKPSMSFIYSKGRDFYGIYRFPTETPVDFIRALEERTGDLTGIYGKDMEESLPPELQLEARSSIVAFVAEGSAIYSVHDFNTEQGATMSRELKNYNIGMFNSDSLINKIEASGEECYAVSPDSLLSTLQHNKVEYAIVASLRANPNANTGRVINTIQRYLYFIQLKYPGILSVVHQIGENNEEPAWLYKINYEYYGL